MTPEDAHEVNAIEYGGRMGGEYLESIGKFNLTELSKEEWQMFCQCICTNYAREMAKDFIPY